MFADFSTTQKPRFPDLSTSAQHKLKAACIMIESVLCMIDGLKFVWPKPNLNQLWLLLVKDDGANSAHRPPHVREHSNLLYCKGGRSTQRGGRWWRWRWSQVRSASPGENCVIGRQARLQAMPLQQHPIFSTALAVLFTLVDSGIDVVVVLV